MPTEVDEMRELARAFWANKPIECPKHRGVFMTGSFVQTTYADHIYLACPRGKETYTLRQRPKQKPFHRQQVEGFVENIQRGDANLCYRCQAPLEMSVNENANTGVNHYTFTCVRCLSYGEWVGHPETAKIGAE